ncbi:hypothetical protein CRENBAI_007035 [Crenichthys baileyi]|uniref:DUF6729 domain-containing protein n=1 Tax=Crenichthys baileyi TaxID=28760 RepID=A0AAV9RTN2_9TELE
MVEFGDFKGKSMKEVRCWPQEALPLDPAPPALWTPGPPCSSHLQSFLHTGKGKNNFHLSAGLDRKKSCSGLTKNREARTDATSPTSGGTLPTPRPSLLSLPFPLLTSSFSRPLFLWMLLKMWAFPLACVQPACNNHSLDSC